MESTALVKALESADTKITRSELIDLIMEEMESELDAEIKAASKRLDTLTNKTFTFDEVKSHLKDVKFTISVDTYQKTTARLSVGGNRGYNESIVVANSDSTFGDYIQACAQATRDLQRLRDQRSNMLNSKRSVKVAIIKRCLEGTKDGRAVLEQVQAMKTALRKQLTSGSRQG